MRILLFCLLTISLSLRATSLPETITPDSLHSATSATAERLLSHCIAEIRLNRGEAALASFRELFATCSDSLTPDERATVATMFAETLSREGLNEAAHTTISHTLENSGDMIAPDTAAGMRTLAKRYSSLAGFTPYGISSDRNLESHIPFSIVWDNSGTSPSASIATDAALINTRPVRMTFDTGHRHNLITDSLATGLGLKPILPDTAICDGAYAIANSLRLGDIEMHDVPFRIVSSSDGLRKPTVGCDLLCKLGDISIDFVNTYITVSPYPAKYSGNQSNMCLSACMTFLAPARIGDTETLVAIDTGHGGYGTVSPSVTATSTTLPLEAGGGAAIIPEMETVATADEYGATLGIQALMMFGKVRLNLTEMQFTCLSPRMTTTGFGAFPPPSNFDFRKEFYAGSKPAKEKESLGERLFPALIGGAIESLIAPGSNYIENVANLMFDYE